MQLKDFKFRIWDNEKRAYVNEPIFLGSDGGIYTWKEACVELEPLENKHFEIELFTGLKDVNGKDIYEGDIVKFDADFDVVQGVVQYESKNAAFYIKEIKNRLYHPLMMYIGFEIIGNIHENAELLKEQEGE